MKAVVECPSSFQVTVICFFVAGCHGRENLARGTAPSKAALDAGVTIEVPTWADRWWLVTDATKERSTIDSSVVLRRDELVFISRGGEWNRKPLAIERCGPSRCTWRFKDSTIRGSLEQISPDEASLKIEDDRDNVVFTLHGRAADVSRELDAEERGSRPSPDACARAEKCCAAALSTIGRSCDVNSELGEPRDPNICGRFVDRARRAFAERGLDLPAPCR